MKVKYHTYTDKHAITTYITANTATRKVVSLMERILLQV